RLEAIVMKALAMNRDDRFERASDMRDALEQFLQEEGALRSSPSVPMPETRILAGPAETAPVDERATVVDRRIGGVTGPTMAAAAGIAMRKPQVVETPTAVPAPTAIPSVAPQPTARAVVAAAPTVVPTIRVEKRPTPTAVRIAVRPQPTAAPVAPPTRRIKQP